MNYSKTSMNYLNILPPRMRQMIYDFDGRYKIAKDKCIELIRQRGQTPTGIQGSDQFRFVWNKINDFNMNTFHRDYPEYYAELERRLSKFRSRMESSGHIRGVTTHLKHLPKSYCFKDALGCYKLGQVFKTVIIDGIAYKSTERVHSVALEKYTFRETTTVVKCIDVLDPVFKKSIKGHRSARIKMYRDLGVSDNGIPGSIFKKILKWRFGLYWYVVEKYSNPPASLAAVTGMIEGAKGNLMSDGSFTLEGKDYKICIKTGTGIIYYGKKAVGYVTKDLKLRLVA